MQLADDGTLLLSATDLVGYLACDHLATLELGRVQGLWKRPIRKDDPTIEIIQQKGDLHEARYLDDLRRDGLTVAEIPKEILRTPDQLRDAQAATLAAMGEGADVVYQATFFDGRWRGHADFLFKRSDRPAPNLGSWSYDVADTKLARSVKAGAVLQMCVYAGLLAELQGVAPEWLDVITGDREHHRYPTEAFAAYFRYVRARFEDRVAAGLAGGPADTYPDPVDHCRVCSWFPTCIDRRRADDHTSLVAGVRRVDTERLVAAGIPTLATLARLDPTTPVEGIAGPQLDRIREQARLQLHRKLTGELVFELIDPDPKQAGRGLAALPEPSPWDLFFDIEADPWATDLGLEYLLGVLDASTGEPVYEPVWATDQAEEKIAFEGFIRRVIERLDAHPEMHVYHYGGYESGAIKRLMQRHDTCAEDVDRLLRGEVLVDLLNVVRQGVRASVERYSLKDIEKFYMPDREGPVTEAGFSVVAFEAWLNDHDQARLDEIAAYNRDDCVSTWQLRAWLEDRRTEAVARWPGLDWTRPVGPSTEPSTGVSDWIREVAAREAALVEDLDSDDHGSTAEARRLLADLLDWHRREEKSQWWRWYELCKEKTVDDLVGERDAIGRLVFMDERDGSRGMVHRRYRFEPQDHRFDTGDDVVDPATGKATGSIVDIDDIAGIIELKRSGRSEWPHPQALVGIAPIDSGVQKRAMLRVADAVIERGIDGPGPYRATRDALLRLPPRRSSGRGGRLVGAGETSVAAARRLGLELADGTLPIQGPPGTGKTYAGARMVLDLAAAGRRVAVTAQSHKTISNFLEALVTASREERVPVRILQKTDTTQGPLDGVARTANNADVGDALARGEVEVVGGTGWLLARPEFDGAFDVLVVDEASQLSLANLVAIGTCARSIVLIGDQNQLPMVTLGVHPDGAEASALGHLVGETATVDPERGLFLETTRRLHPDIDAFISPAIYGGRLETHPSTAERAVISSDPDLDGTGLRWIPVEHEGNGPRSREEAEVVAATIEALTRSTWRDIDGRRQPITLDKVIVVAPYNAQVAEIQAALVRRLGSRADVGTVDKFQGREGVVAIYSMASSSREDAPRDMGFLYSPNRFNVAVSRAQAMAIVVASPKLLEAGCRSPEQMRMVDLLCRYVEVATEQAIRDGRTEPTIAVTRT